jgi:hypothetical protein
MLGPWQGSIDGVRFWRDKGEQQEKFSVADKTEAKITEFLDI